MIISHKKFIYNNTIKLIFNKIYKKYPKNIFLSNSKISNNGKIKNYTYEDVKKEVTRNVAFFKKNNFHIGDRIAIMVGNTPEYFILKLSLNYYGLSCIPINKELSINEITYILDNSDSKYLVISSNGNSIIKKILEKFKKKLSVLTLNNSNRLNFLIKNSFNIVKTSKKLNSKTESSILYTSGTTGKPKGCILNHEYEINAGYSYAKKKGLISFKVGKERLYNCLPVHHVNSGILSFFAMMITGNCQIQSERFSVKNFWKEINITKATVFHYLGVMAPLLLKNKNNKIEKENCLRIGVGAGIEPTLHSKFEKRFKIPMIELWGMTEMVRCIYANEKNRIIGKRYFGKISDGLETKVINESGKEVFDIAGNFFIRFNKQKPKTGFFSMYNKNKIATENAWKNGWFHTGDIVIKDKKGNHFFVDRAKNIIRRSGENISSAEVEQALLSLKYVINCSVLPITHEYYEEEVFAFIVISKKIKKNIYSAKTILKDLKDFLAYFKLPSYIKFLENLPLTSSQKTNRSALKNIMLSLKKSEYINLEDFKRNLKK